MLDFYCLERRIAVEVDGIVHEMGDGPERDKARDAWLSGRNVTVLRLAARDILADPSDAAQAIVEQLRSL